MVTLAAAGLVADGGVIIAVGSTWWRGDDDLVVDGEGFAFSPARGHRRRGVQRRARIDDYACGLQRTGDSVHTTQSVFRSVPAGVCSRVSPLPVTNIVCRTSFSVSVESHPFAAKRDTAVVAAVSEKKIYL